MFPEHNLVNNPLLEKFAELFKSVGFLGNFPTAKFMKNWNLSWRKSSDMDLRARIEELVCATYTT